MTWVKLALLKRPEVKSGKSKSKIRDFLIDLEEGSITYTSYFKNGVVAYDKDLEEHFLLFAPDTLYHWSMVGKKARNYLIVGTLGEGLVLINVETLERIRHRLDVPDNDVRILKVKRNKAIVNNTREIELPTEGGIIEGRTVLSMVEPEHPDWAEKKEVTDIVKVKCWVLPNGEVSQVEIVLTSGWPELDEYACEVLMKWTFDAIEGEEIQSGIVTFSFGFEK